jgi:hypothetical protein
VQKVGKLKVHLSGVEMEHFQAKDLGNRGRVVKFDYKIVQTMGTSQGSLLFKALTVDNQTLGLSEIVLPPPEASKPR